MQNSEIIIELSKKKIVLLVIGAFGFVALGFWLLSIGSKSSNSEFFLIGIAIASIAFFGICGIYGVIKMFDNKPGLVITQTGILDNTSAISGQLIKWENMIGVEEIQIQSTRLLLIYVNNTEEILSKTTPWKRFWMTLNVKWYGTPISLSSGSLKCSFNELKEIIKKKIEQRTNVQQRF